MKGISWNLMETGIGRRSKKKNAVFLSKSCSSYLTFKLSTLITIIQIKLKWQKVH